MIPVWQTRIRSRYAVGMIDGFFHYSFLEGRLIGSEHPDARGRAPERILSMLPDPPAATLLTLTRQNVPDFRIVGLMQRHLPMGDTPTRDQIAEAVEIVRSRLSAGERVWVHCQRGIDRTASVIGSYLVCTGAKPDEVIRQLFDRFPRSFQSPRMRELWEPNEEMIRSFAQSAKS